MDAFRALPLATATSLFLLSGLVRSEWPGPVGMTSSATSVRPSEPPIVVGPTVHVSASMAGIPHDEVILATDPADVRRLVACSMMDPAPGSTEESTRSVVYASFDGGETWRHGATTELNAVDPSCGYASDGSVYFVTSSPWKAWDRLGTWTLEVHRSPDGGRSWDEPHFSAGGDRPWLVIDHASSARPTPIYVTYHTAIHPLRADARPAPFGLYLKRSDDGGMTWTAPAIRLGETGRNEASGITPERAVMLSDGTVVILYLTPGEFPEALPTRPPLRPKSFAQFITTSSDQGQTLADGVKVADYAMLHGSTGAPGGFAALAVDPGSPWFTDRLYATWGDVRTGRSEIWFSYSHDKGTTWSPPRIVSDDQAWPPPAVGPDNNVPTVAVNKLGVVGLTWYDRRDNPDNVGFYPRFRASLDGGETWLPSVRVSEVANRFESGEALRLRASVTRVPGNGPLIVSLQRHWWVINGHTAGLAADAEGVFHALWVDNRTGVNQVYTASITTPTAVARNGRTELAALEDITARMSVELNGGVYDGERHTLAIRARLRNISDRSLVGPLVMRVLRVTSELGAARVIGLDGSTGEGSSFAFTTPAGGLAPGAATDEKAIDSQVFPLRSVKEGNDVRLGLLKLDVRILGKTQ